VRRENLVSADLRDPDAHPRHLPGPGIAPYSQYLYGPVLVPGRSDLSICLNSGRTLEELAQLVFDLLDAGVPYESTLERVRSQFALSSADAALGVDRAMGGLVRAASAQPMNCPDPNQDPIARASFALALRHPANIAALVTKLNHKESASYRPTEFHVIESHGKA
jgi:hypothetical protein